MVEDVRETFDRSDRFEAFLARVVNPSQPRTSSQSGVSKGGAD